MWGIVLLLFLVVIGYSCPVELIFKQETLPECEKVCQEVKDKTGFSHVEQILSTGGQAGQNTAVARICACKLYDDKNEPYNILVCAYEYTYDPVDKVKQSLKMQGVAEDIPGQLVKLFTFRGGSVSMHDTGALVLSGFYSAYVEAIRGWTSFFALALVVIIAGWNMTLPAATTLVQKIRHKETEMQALSAAEIIRTAMAVIPAVSFFALPVPVSDEGLIFMKNVKPAQGKVKIVGQKDQEYDAAYQAVGQEDNENSAYLNTALCDFYDRQAQRATDQQLAREYEEQARACRERLGENLSCEYYENRAQEYQEIDEELAERYRNLADKCREDKQKEEEQDLDDQIKGEEQGNRWSKPRFVLYKGEDVYMPLAIGLVGSFIEFGVNGANAVSKVVNGILIEYQTMKINKSATAMREAKQKLEKWKEDVEKAEKQLESLEQTASECGVTQCNGISEAVYKKDLSEKCRDILHLYAAYCQSVFTYSKQQQEQQQEQQQQQGRQRGVEKDIRAVADNIGSSFSWLSPAINSQAILYALFTQMSAKDNKEVKLKKVYHAVYAPADNFSGGVKYYWNTFWEGAKDSIGGFVHGIKSGFGEIGAAMNLAKKGIESAREGGLEIGLSKSDWFVFGSALTISSVPPASQIKDVIANMGQWASGVVAKIMVAISAGLAVAGLGIPAMVLGSSAGLTTLAGSVVSVLGGIAIAYGAGLLFWSAAPQLVVSAVVIMLFIGYLFDIAKFMLTLPFFAVGAATKRPEATLQFFGHTLKLTTTPLLIALMPLVAFVAIELVMFFFFIVPSTLILAGVSVADSVIAYFLGGMAVGLMYIVAHILGIMVAWDVSTSFIEGVYSYVNNMMQSYQTSGTQLAQSVKGMVVSGLGGRG